MKRRLRPHWMSLMSCAERCGPQGRRHNALYLKLEDSEPSESEEVSPGIVLDFDVDGRVIGIEILNVSEHGDRVDLKSVVLENA